MEAFKNTSPLSILKLGAVLLVLHGAMALGNLVSEEAGSIAFFSVLGVCIVVAVVLGVRDRLSDSATPLLQVALLAGSVIIAAGLGVFGILRRRKSRASAESEDSPQPEPEPTTTTSVEEENVDAGDESTTRRKRDVAKAAALKAATVLRRELPGILSQSFFDALKFGAAAAVVGVLIAAGVWGLDRQATFPSWLHLLQVFLIPILLTAAGVYVGAFRGFLSALSHSMRRRGMVDHFYRLCQPIALGVVASLNKKVSPAKKDLMRSVHEQSRALFVAGAERAAEEGAALSQQGSTVRLSVFERLQQKLSNSIAQRLCVIVLMPKSDQSRANIVAEYESISIATLETKLDETIAGLFSTQQLLVTAGAAALVTLPYALAIALA